MEERRRGACRGQAFLLQWTPRPIPVVWWSKSVAPMRPTSCRAMFRFRDVCLNRRQKIAVYGFVASAALSGLTVVWHKWATDKLANAKEACEAALGSPPADDGHEFDIYFSDEKNVTSVLNRPVTPPSAATVREALQENPCSQSQLSQKITDDQNLTLLPVQRELRSAKRMVERTNTPEFDRFQEVLLVAGAIAALLTGPEVLYWCGFGLRRTWLFFLVRVREFSDAIRGMDPPPD